MRYLDQFIRTRFKKNIVQNNWFLLFRQDIPWPTVIEAAAQLAGISLTAFIIGWVVFEKRDIKS